MHPHRMMQGDPRNQRRHVGCCQQRPVRRPWQQAPRAPSVAPAELKRINPDPLSPPATAARHVADRFQRPRLLVELQRSPSSKKSGAGPASTKSRGTGRGTDPATVHRQHDVPLRRQQPIEDIAPEQHVAINDDPFRPAAGRRRRRAKPPPRSSRSPGFRRSRIPGFIPGSATRRRASSRAPPSRPATPAPPQRLDQPPQQGAVRGYPPCRAADPPVAAPQIRPPRAPPASTDRLWRSIHRQIPAATPPPTPRSPVSAKISDTRPRPAPLDIPQTLVGVDLSRHLPHGADRRPAPDGSPRSPPTPPARRNASVGVA